MEAKHFLRSSLTSAWIFLFLFSSFCTGINGQEINLNKAVFVAFPGDDLSINVTLHNLTNQTSEDLLCWDPFNNLAYSAKIKTIHENEFLTVKLKNLNCSGLYNCKYNKAEVHWYLLMTAKGQKVPQMWDVKFIIVAALIAVLLVFSVLGSVYVFRGYWTEKRSETLGMSRKQKQKREDQKETEKEEDNMDMTTAQSSSFYASLEPRPRSIYDVLDCSAANSDDQQIKPKSPEKELSKVEENIAEHQDEGIFESVYENF